MAGFTAIAAGVGMAGQAGTSLMSFGQASAAKRKANDARLKGEKLMREARERAEKNVYAKLKLPLDAFNEQYRQNAALQTQQVDALQEGGQRALAAGIGKVAAASNANTETIRIGQGKAQTQLDKLKADAEEKIKQQTISMDVSAGQDALEEEALLKEQAAAATQKGFASGTKALVGGLGMAAPLFGGEKMDDEDFEKYLGILGMGPAGVPA
tara:strand:- start:9734 stop:10369 length:636 start_codon:yes stop_codon:yes gene_type:complete